MHETRLRQGVEVAGACSFIDGVSRHSKPAACLHALQQAAEPKSRAGIRM